MLLGLFFLPVLVSEATGQVVASAQSGSELKRQGSERLDYSKLSLTQAKRFEMESQVKALELEKELEMERTRLAELRKIHYHLAGASEGWEEVRMIMLSLTHVEVVCNCCYIISSCRNRPRISRYGYTLFKSPLLYNIIITLIVLILFFIFFSPCNE
jgi:hypothetical protein